MPSRRRMAELAASDTSSGAPVCDPMVRAGTGSRSFTLQVLRTGHPLVRGRAGQRPVPHRTVSTEGSGGRSDLRIHLQTAIRGRVTTATGGPFRGVSWHVPARLRSGRGRRDRRSPPRVRTDAAGCCTDRSSRVHLPADRRCDPHDGLRASGPIVHERGRRRPAEPESDRRFRPHARFLRLRPRAA